MIKGQCHCGKVSWELAEKPSSATACSCTVCRRYGAIWAYGAKDANIKVSGETQPYIRGEAMLGFHFCTDCACVAYWLATAHDDDGYLHMAVNLRLAEPDAVADIAIDHFDGFDTWSHLGQDGRCVRDMWF